MKLKVNPTGEELITLDAAKDFLQVEKDASHDDYLIVRLCKAARQMVETVCAVSLMDKEIELATDMYEAPWLLPYGPVKEVIESDVDGVEPDIEGDYVKTPGKRLEIKYRTGYNEVPGGLEQAVYDLLKLYYDARGQQIQLPDTLLGALQKYNRNILL